MTASTDPHYDVVVVHYDNPDVYGVVAAALEQRTPPRRVVIVDNSRTLDRSRVAAVAPSAQVVPSPNDGYAAAVNLGVRELADDPSPVVVVLTHEVRLTEDTLPRLVATIAHHPTLGAAGPVLRYRSDPDRLFSLGGRLDRLGRPSHVTDGEVGPVAPRPVRWIDGSVMALRRDALEGIELLDERYFLYYEEIDLAVRLKAAGWGVAVDPRADAWQEPGAYPPYLGARNRVLLMRSNPSLARSCRVLLYPRLVLEIAWTTYRRGLRTLPASLHGLLDGVRGAHGVPSR